MTVNFTTSEEGYIAYLKNFSRVTTIGQNARKRFYLGFSFIYLLLWIAIFYYVIVNGQIPTPYFFMSIIIFVVLNIYMRYIDIHTLGAVRRAQKDIMSNTVQLNKKITIDIESEHINVLDDNESTRFKTKNVQGISFEDDFVIIYVTETKSYVLPITSIQPNSLKTIQNLFDNMEAKK